MIKFICDGCGKEQKATWYPAARTNEKPKDWFVRADQESEQHACSRECIKKIAEKTGKTTVVLPI